MKRIVSLIAGGTEIVCALGFEGQMVGRSHECDFPASVASLPALTEPKFNTEGASREIDDRVKAILQEALSVYRVHAEELEAVRPDVIITQTQCEVCAVSLKDVEEAVCGFTGGQAPQVVSLEPNGLGDVWEDIRRVARALDAEDRGEAPHREIAGANEGDRRPVRDDRRPSHRRLYRVDRPPHGCGELGAHDGGDGGRDQPLRERE